MKGAPVGASRGSPLSIKLSMARRSASARPSLASRVTAPTAEVMSFTVAAESIDQRDEECAGTGIDEGAGEIGEGLRTLGATGGGVAG